ncbi:replication protein RepA [Candidatus Profftella armatura]|uniref:replication protein RepA n=1 Tax=Candidatus Profftella armatura TaxID=669502 RepID=UPI0015DC8416|nr:replication protein RepA [Candidatus Profftella armatura]QLK13970.1 hypothetical protein FK495_02005 [Candidatus Profftella armatura]
MMKKKNNFSSRLLISESSHIFWNTKTRKKKWESSLELSDGFFREIIDASVPIDIRIFHALSKSPLAMDIYTWLVYRIFILQKSKLSSVFISWINLKFQFGVGYPNTNQGFRDFKKRFRLRLKEVLFFYKKAKRHVRENKIGLIITSCDLHISKLNSKNKND